MVGDLLEDMATHRSWGWTENGLPHAMEETERALVRMTAQMPIRFTRILLGGDAGPHWTSGFVPGAVTDAGIVKQTPVYQEAVRKYPEVTDWPALCTVYVGRGLPSALGTVDASEFDLKIMNRTGDKFLGQQGVRCVGGPYQMTMQAAEQTAIQYPFLQGSRPLAAGDLDVYEWINAENGCITFCLDVLADEEAVFGRQRWNHQPPQVNLHQIRTRRPFRSSARMPTRYQSAAYSMRVGFQRPPTITSKHCPQCRPP